jgi:valyl-tRNA synthetase
MFAPTGEFYSIDTPPPTVSGSLHIGHLFSYTQAEMIVRFRRIQGDNGGLKIHVARKEIIRLLEEKNLLIKSEKMTHVVAMHECCGKEIEIIPCIGVRFEYWYNNKYMCVDYLFQDRSRELFLRH